MSQPRATLRTLDLSHLGPGIVRYEVNCPAGRTGLTMVPSERLHLPEQTLILVVAWEHEGRCGRCCIEDVLDQGDQEMRQMTEELWPKIQGALLMRGRRN